MKPNKAKTMIKLRTVFLMFFFTVTHTNSIVTECLNDKNTFKPLTFDENIVSISSREKSIESVVEDVNFVSEKENDKDDFKSSWYVSLCKNIIDGKNVLTKDMVLKSNTTYIVLYDYDLLGETITIPEKCVLKFQGGSLKNGTIVGIKTSIYAKNNVIFKNNITIRGTWNNKKVSSKWFNLYNSKTLENILYLCDGDDYTFVDIEKCDIDINGYIDDDVDYGGADFINVISNSLSVPSNTYIDFNGGTLNIIPNKRKYYSAISIINAENVTIKNLNVLGDADTHTQGEYGYGIDIRGSKNIIIENFLGDKLSGDAISIGSYNNDGLTIFQKCENVKIYKSKLYRARRNGLTVTYASDVVVDRCEIKEIGTINGTLPKCGIDLEPNNWNSIHALLDYKSIDNVRIVNSTITGCAGRSIDAISYDERPTVHNISIENVICDSGVRISSHADNVYIDNSNLKVGVFAFENGYVKNTNFDGFILLDNTTSFTIERCNITTDYKKTKTITEGMGIALYNHDICDASNTIVKECKITLLNFSDQTYTPVVFPISRAGAWNEKFYVKGIPSLINNTFVSNDLPIALCIGSNTINNVLFNCQNFNLIKTRRAKFVVSGNSVNNEYGFYSITKNRYTNEFEASDTIIIAQNKIKTPVYGNLFTSMLGTFPYVIEFDNTIKH